jgi:hypothetical protein
VIQTGTSFAEKSLKLFPLEVEVAVVLMVHQVEAGGYHLHCQGLEGKMPVKISGHC